MLGSSISKADIEELAIKVAHLESSVANALGQTNAERKVEAPQNNNMSIQTLFRETDDLRMKLVELEQRQLSTVGTGGHKLKTFWSKMFN